MRYVQMVGQEARGLVRNGKYEAFSMLYKSVPEVLSELIRTAFVARDGYKFVVPVEKHGQNAYLRQKGKVAELALGYGGSAGALIFMGALDMGLTEEELQPLVDIKGTVYACGWV